MASSVLKILPNAGTKYPVMQMFKNVIHYNVTFIFLTDGQRLDLLEAQGHYYTTIFIQGLFRSNRDF